MSLALLPLDVLLEMTKNLSLTEINNLCQSSKEVNQAICNNEDFWMYKFTYDYGYSFSNITNWKELYASYNNLFFFGALGDRTADVPTFLSGIKPKMVSAGEDHLLIIISKTTFGLPEAMKQGSSVPRRRN